MFFVVLFFRVNCTDLVTQESCVAALPAYAYTCGSSDKSGEHYSNDIVLLLMLCVLIFFMKHLWLSAHIAPCYQQATWSKQNPNKKGKEVDGSTTLRHTGSLLVCFFV